MARAQQSAKMKSRLGRSPRKFPRCSPERLWCPKKGGLHDVLLASSGLDSLDMISLMHFTSTKYHVKVGMQLLMDKKTSIRSLANFISQSASKTVSEMAIAPINVMAEINKHDAKIAAAQLGTS
jgi:hypothetical protein